MATFAERESHEAPGQEPDSSLPTTTVSSEQTQQLNSAEISGSTVVKPTNGYVTNNRKLEKSLFEQIINEEKREIQLTECQVRPGETIILEEWDQENNAATGRQLTITVSAVHPVEEVPEGSIDEATEHGCVTIQFKSMSSLSPK